MVVVREAVLDDWKAFRDTRLEALQDAPEAFMSTSQERAGSSDAYWQRRISRGGTFLAFLPETETRRPAGLAGGYKEDAWLDRAELVSLWVRPRARGRGVAKALIAAVAGWATSRNVRFMHLWVTESNIDARKLYERCGFSLTGEIQPLPSNLKINEIGMIRPL